MSEFAVSLRHVAKVFSTEAESLTILRDVNLDVAQGQTVAITGESGCGKSTLLSIIGGLDRSSSGEVRCGDFLVSGMGEEALTSYRSGHLGFVFQFHYLLKDFTSLENVMLAGLMNGMRRSKAREKAAALIADVGLSERGNHYPNQLSGGERQRVAVARALMNDPQLILADEPTGNLDEGNSAMIFALLFDLVSKYGKTLILVTHDLSLADRCGMRYRLHEGELAAL
jgi:lipoprotein-releasing system ATP-binding protein